MVYYGQRIKCHVYLEGVEVDFNTISITESAEMPPTATIKIPAKENIINLLPKTVGVITYEDIDDSGNIVEYIIYYGELTGYGMQRMPDSREVLLTFTSLTNNWNSSYIVPIDITIPTAATMMLLGINYYAAGADNPNSSMIFFKDNVSPLMQLSQKVQHYGSWGKAMNAVITQMNQTVGTYLSHVNRALRITDTMTVIDSNIMSSIINTTSLINYLRGLTRQLDSHLTITQGIQQILPYFAYDFCELAAPTYFADSSLPVKKIFIKPKTQLLSPIMCNIMFDDDVASLQYARDINMEPTRLVSMSNPFYTQGTETQNLHVLIATVAPQGVVVGNSLNYYQNNHKKIAAEVAQAGAMELGVTSINNDIAKRDQFLAQVSQKDTTESTKLENFNLRAVQIKRTQDRDAAELALTTEMADTEEKINAVHPNILTLTNEEKIRGVNLDYHQDTTGIEQAYLIGAYGNPDIVTDAQYLEAIAADPVKRKAQGDALYAMFVRNNVQTTESGITADTAHASSAINDYHVKMAQLYLKENKRQNRSITITGSYSPYRVCGFPSLILTTDFDPLIGYLQQTQTTISSDGQSSQICQLSHVAVVGVSGINASFLDNYTIDLPSWLSDFSFENVGTNLYSVVMNSDASSISDYCVKHTIEDCIAQLKKEYAAHSALADRADYVKDITQRPLVTLDAMKTFLLCDTNGFLKEQPLSRWNSAAPVPFMIERRQAVEAAFKGIGIKSYLGKIPDQGASVLKHFIPSIP